MRGKANNPLPPEPTAGSPPRVRGKVLAFTMASSPLRITPACAGKSDVTDGNYWLLEDHPRVCGEKSTARGSVKYILGSPPRVRGKVLAFTMASSPLRITPACAGKSDVTDGNYWLLEDHPRVCGEKLVLPVQNSSCRGSPPRVRGKGPMAFCY